MLKQQLRQECFSFRCQSDQYVAAIGGVLLALDKASGDGTIDKLDGAVVLDEQPVRNLANRRRTVGAGEATQREQQLVLLWLEPGAREACSLNARNRRSSRRKRARAAKSSGVSAGGRAGKTRPIISADDIPV